MTSHVEQIRAMLAESDGLRDCLTKFDLVDEAVRIADLHQDVVLGVESRLRFIRVARQLHRGDEMAVAFTWCLHQYDRRPDIFGGRDLFWEYTELIGQLSNFDTVSRAQLEEMLDDLAARLTREGRSLAPLWLMRREMGPDLGDRAMSIEAVARLARFGKDGELSTAERFHQALFVGDEDEAMRIADAEWLSRPQGVPYGTKWYSSLILLLKKDRRVELRRWQQRALAKLAVLDSYYWEYGRVVASLVLSGRTTEAVKLAGQCQRVLHPFTDPMTRFYFHLDMCVLFDRLAALGRDTVLVRFAEGPPGKLPNGRYVVADVRDWLVAERDALAARFDHRNGTDYFAEMIRQRAELQQYAQPEVE